MDFGEVKAKLLELTTLTGSIAAMSLGSPSHQDQLAIMLLQCLHLTLVLCDTIGVKLHAIILKKIDLNKRQYHACTSKEDVQTSRNLSNETDTVEEDQLCILDKECWSCSTDRPVETFFSQMPGIIKALDDFAKTRKRNNNYSNSNVVLALLGEIGELAELFLWKDDKVLVASCMGKYDIDLVAQEIADVAIYTIHLMRTNNVHPSLEQYKMATQKYVEPGTK